MRNPLLVLLIAALLAACGGSSGDATDDATDEPTGAATTEEPVATTEAATATTAPADTETAAAATATAAAGAATVATADSDLGVILVDADGRSLYLFTNDSEGASTCTGDCAANWPAFVTEGDASAEGDADASLLATIEREDGATQVTYAGHPLYYFAADSAPGDINGHEVGDVWYLVTPDGEQAGEETAAADDSY